MNKEFMENLAPPMPTGKFSGKAATPAGVNSLVNDNKNEPLAVSLSGIANVWSPSCQNCEGGQPLSCCIGGYKFANNCAHFLSDALVRVGFTELLTDGALFKCHVPECTLEDGHKRPVRARELRDWFKRKAIRKRENIDWQDIQENSGWWAIFQLDENVYWGGHVIILDTTSWEYYGTCNYPEWKQNLYQW